MNALPSTLIDIYACFRAGAFRLPFGRPSEGKEKQRNSEEKVSPKKEETSNTRISLVIVPTLAAFSLHQLCTMRKRHRQNVKTLNFIAKLDK